MPRFKVGYHGYMVVSAESQEQAWHKVEDFLTRQTEESADYPAELLYSVHTTDYPVTPFERCPDCGALKGESHFVGCLSPEAGTVKHAEPTGEPWPLDAPGLMLGEAEGYND